VSIGRQYRNYFTAGKSNQFCKAFGFTILLKHSQVNAFTIGFTILLKHGQVNAFTVGFTILLKHSQVNAFTFQYTCTRLVLDYSMLQIND